MSCWWYKIWWETAPYAVTYMVFFRKRYNKKYILLSQILTKPGLAEAPFVHLKTYKNCGTRVFFYHYSLATPITKWEYWSSTITKGFQCLWCRSTSFKVTHNSRSISKVSHIHYKRTSVLLVRVWLHHAVGSHNTAVRLRLCAIFQIQRKSNRYWPWQPLTAWAWNNKIWKSKFCPRSDKKNMHNTLGWFDIQRFNLPYIFRR